MPYWMYIASYLFVFIGCVAFIGGCLRAVGALRRGNKQEAQKYAVATTAIALMFSGFIVRLLTHFRNGWEGFVGVSLLVAGAMINLLYRLLQERATKKKPFISPQKTDK